MIKLMKKIILIIGLILIVTSCSIRLKSSSFFDKPYSKIRLLETLDHSKTGLNYAVSYIKINDSINIETWEISTQEPKHLFFLFSPSKSSIAISSEIMEKIALKTNSKVIGIQYRGYNYSDGKPSLKTSYDDNLIIFNHYKEKFREYKTINLIGMSIGTVFLPKIVRNNENIINNIFLLSTFSTPKTMLKEIKRIHVPWLVRPLIKFKPDTELLKINGVKELENYTNGLMIFHAKNDKATGYRMAIEMYNKSNSIKKKLISFDDGGHFAPYSEKYIDKVVNDIHNFIDN